MDREEIGKTTNWICTGGRAFPHLWQMCSLASGVESLLSMSNGGRNSVHRLYGLAGRGGGVLYRMCTEMPSTAHAQWWLSTPLAREYVCQWCGKALPPLGIEPLPPAPKARALKGRAIWTLVVSLRYRRYIYILSDLYCLDMSMWK